MSEEIDRLKSEVEQAKADRNRIAVQVRSEMLKSYEGLRKFNDTLLLALIEVVANVPYRECVKFEAGKPPCDSCTVCKSNQALNRATEALNNHAK